MNAYKITRLSFVLDRNRRFAILLRDLELPVLHIALDFRIINRATNETLRIEYGIIGIVCMRILGTVSNAKEQKMSS